MKAIGNARMAVRKFVSRFPTSTSFSLSLIFTALVVLLTPYTITNGPEGAFILGIFEPFGASFLFPLPIVALYLDST